MPHQYAQVGIKIVPSLRFFHPSEPAVEKGAELERRRASTSSPDGDLESDLDGEVDGELDGNGAEAGWVHGGDLLRGCGCGCGSFQCRRGRESEPGGTGVEVGLVW